jgi:hypothetical protein
MAFQLRGPMVPQTNGGLRNPGWPAQKPCFRNNGSIEQRFTLRLERGFVLQQRGALLAPSARPAGLDDVDGGPDCRVYIQMRCIEQVRIRRAL